MATSEVGLSWQQNFWRETRSLTGVFALCSGAGRGVQGPLPLLRAKEDGQLTRKGKAPPLSRALGPNGANKKEAEQEGEGRAVIMRLHHYLLLHQAPAVKWTDSQSQLQLLLAESQSHSKFSLLFSLGDNESVVESGWTPGFPGYLRAWLLHQPAILTEDRWIQLMKQWLSKSTFCLSVKLCAPKLLADTTWHESVGTHKCEHV